MEDKYYKGGNQIYVRNPKIWDIEDWCEQIKECKDLGMWYCFIGLLDWTLEMWDEYIKEKPKDWHRDKPLDDSRRCSYLVLNGVNFLIEECHDR